MESMRLKLRWRARANRNYSGGRILFNCDEINFRDLIYQAVSMVITGRLECGGGWRSHPSSFHFIFAKQKKLNIGFVLCFETYSVYRLCVNIAERLLRPTVILMLTASIREFETPAKMAITSRNATSLCSINTNRPPPLYRFCRAE